VFGATPAAWLVDASESEARFEAATLWGRVAVSGRLGEVTGELEWNGAAGTGALAIATAGVATGIWLRDRHLRSREFFHAARHPEIRFDFREVLVEAGKVRLGGDLAVRGTRHPFACTAAVASLDSDRVVLEAVAPFDLGELGMSRGLFNMLPPIVAATARVTLRRARP
jgi:polyisoprenoid-binding protein YceI